MQWLLRRQGEEEKRKGRRVRIFYGKIIIDGLTWLWDEQREVLRDWRGGGKHRRKGERRKKGRKKEKRRGHE